MGVAAPEASLDRTAPSIITDNCPCPRRPASDSRGGGHQRPAPGFTCSRSSTPRTVADPVIPSVLGGSEADPRRSRQEAPDWQPVAGFRIDAVTLREAGHRLPAPQRLGAAWGLPAPGRRHPRHKAQRRRVVAECDTTGPRSVGIVRASCDSCNNAAQKAVHPRAERPAGQADQAPGAGSTSAAGATPETLARALLRRVEPLRPRQSKRLAPTPQTAEKKHDKDA